MTQTVKEVFKSLLRACGLEVVRYTPEQKDLVKATPGLRYRDLLIQKAITLPGGQISLAEARFLLQLVRNLESHGPIIEVGTLFGWSARLMACHKSDARELITVDNYSWNPLHLSSDMHFRVTQQVLAEAVDTFHVRQLRVDKDDFYRTYKGEAPALVFLDAIHTYEATKADILWAKHIEAGVVCGHDYREAECPGVVKAVDEFGGPRELVQSLWVL